MHTLDMNMAPAPGLSLLPLAGPGTPSPAAPFHLILCRVDGPAPQPFYAPENAVEQVFYVISGRGILHYGEHHVVLVPRCAHRVAAAVPMALESQDATALHLLYLASPLPPATTSADAVCLEDLAGLNFPAARWGRSITNGGSPLKTNGFTAGLSLLAAGGGQVPWHNHPDRQHEIYLLLGGHPQMCVGAEVRELTPPAAVSIPGDQWHQLTNLHARTVLPLVYCYEGSVAAPHWWQERDGVLPAAGVQGNPPLPAAAFPQCCELDETAWRRIAATHLRADANGAMNVGSRNGA